MTTKRHNLIINDVTAFSVLVLCVSILTVVLMVNIVIESM